MPVIKEEDLLDLYTELDKLKVDKEKLGTGFVDLKLKSNKKERQHKVNKLIFIIILMTFIISLRYLYVNNKSFKLVIDKAEEKQLVLLDSIQKLMQLTPIETKTGVVYSIQLGIFKKLNIEFNNIESKNLKKVETAKGLVYQIGDFSTYKEATAFKNKIKKIGLKDAFLVAYDKNHKRIDIKEALILSNE